VSGLTDSEGMLHQSYRYDPFGGIDFGKPQYNNVYAYNAESYNGNTEHQYLRAWYYDTDTADFITEDSYLGQISDPLTLNRYNYVKSSPSNYTDPSGHKTTINIDYDKIWKEIIGQQYKSADKAFKQELKSLPGSTTIKIVADFITENAWYLAEATTGVAIFMLTAPASLPVLFLVSEAMVIGGIGGLVLGNLDKELSKWEIRRELKKYGVNIDASGIYIHQMDQPLPEVQSLCESYNYDSDQQQTYWDATEVLVGIGAIGMSVAQVWEIFGDSLKKASSDFGTNLKSWWNALTGKAIAEGAGSGISTADKVKISNWKYPPNEEVYLANKNTFDNPNYFDQTTGEIKWLGMNGDPNVDGFLNGISRNESLQPGMLIDRYGNPSGKFTSPQGIPFENRALSPTTDMNNYHTYEIIKPVEVQSGEIAPWFDQPGGGIQYRFNDTIQNLINNGILREVN